MSSLPPSVIKIKRKATDAPLEFLRIHEAPGKRQRRQNDFIFSRQLTSESENAPSVLQPGAIPPTNRRILPLHRSSSSRSLVPQQPKPSSNEQSIPEVPTRPLEVNRPLSSSSSESAKKAQPRRFHISRNSTAPITPISGGGIGKRVKQEPIVFFERRARQKTSQDKADAAAEKLLAEAAVAKEEDRPRKKPGRGSRVIVSKDATTPTKPKLPQAILNPWGMSEEELTKQMQEFTLQEMGRSIAESDAAAAAHVPRSPAGASSRFKPKKPELRYAERHPEEMELSIDHTSDFETDEEMGSDSEYIIETYHRRPAEDIEIEDTDVNYGLLVLDSQPDIDQFYGGEEDSDGEEDDVEEDENAENHYTADYPDEEVDSDDEFGRNAYNYRTGNASDLEEWDEDDVDDMGFSDDESDNVKYPWMKTVKNTGAWDGDDEGEEEEKEE